MTSEEKLSILVTLAASPLGAAMWPGWPWHPGVKMVPEKAKEAAREYAGMLGVIADALICEADSLSAASPNPLDPRVRGSDAERVAYDAWRAKHPTCPPHDSDCPNAHQPLGTPSPIPLVGCGACEWMNEAPL